MAHDPLLTISASAKEMSVSLDKLAEAFRKHEKKYEIALYRLGHRWNRYQMVSDRR